MSTTKEFTCPCCYRTEDTTEAHCELHIAAPELLEALRGAETLISADIVRDDAGCLAKIRAAIAKAEGKGGAR